MGAARKCRFGCKSGLKDALQQSPHASPGIEFILPSKLVSPLQLHLFFVRVQETPLQLEALPHLLNHTAATGGLHCETAQSKTSKKRLRVEATDAERSVCAAAAFRPLLHDRLISTFKMFTCCLRSMDLTYLYLSEAWDSNLAVVEVWLDRIGMAPGRPNVADLQRSITNKKQQIKKQHADLFAACEKRTVTEDFKVCCMHSTRCSVRNYFHGFLSCLLCVHAL